MDKLTTIKTFCCGCRVCESIEKVRFIEDLKGFPQPCLDKKNLALCERICPASGRLWDSQSGSIWGDYNDVFLGWSCDKDIRNQASSGGVLTGLCLFLLEKNIVDGIIQTRRSSHIPFATETVVSVTREDVLACMGSRYSISSPLQNINSILDKDKKYCFVGKPCDIYVLKAISKQYPEFEDRIPICLSFFCAGMPSVEAQNILLGTLLDGKECIDLRYRGNGWPGYTTAIDREGEIHQMSYCESWGQILGRDVRWSCRFCIDGIGAFADIACGDAWNIIDGKPVFTEGDGRNVVFSRSIKGRDILTNAQMDRYICLEPFEEDIDSLRLMQRYQYERRATMSSMLSAMRLAQKPIPCYPRSLLKSFSKAIDTKTKFRRFAGTLKRIIKGTI